MRRKPANPFGKYDHLVVACGAQPATYGTKGVEEHSFFMKELEDSRRIRNHILGCLEAASLPGLPTMLDLFSRSLRLAFGVLAGYTGGTSITMTKLCWLLFDHYSWQALAMGEPWALSVVAFGGEILMVVALFHGMARHEVRVTSYLLPPTDSY